MGLMGKSSGGPAVGIDIGTSLIKVVEARPGKDGVQITALGIAPTPPGCIDNEIVVDPQSLGRAVRQLLTESGISCKHSVSSVSGQSSVIVRIIEVPKMTKQELVETMKWEIERHVPFAANEVVMDFQPVERPDASPDDQNMEVLLAVAQQEVVNTHVETLFAAGVDPTAIDVESLAAARSLIDASENGAAEGTVAVVNIGATSTELAIYKDGILAFPRTLPIAGNAITRALSDNLSISIPQAERLKREKAVVMMDRVDLYSSGGSMDGFGETDSTMGFQSPVAEEQSADAGFGFIPGLGFSFDQEEQSPQPAAAPQDSMPDFDIDIGAPSAPTPVMDFDLSGSDLGSASDSKFDLSDTGSADMGDDTSAAVLDLTTVDDSASTELVDYPPETIFDIIAPVLSDLAAEIRRSLDYYISRYQTQPDRIFLCGGTARLKDLDQLIQAELGIPVTVANPMQNVTVLSKSLSESYLEEVAAILPVSIGLAIRDMIGE